ncbi:NAD(P)H-quinone oxidoreductase [Naumannella sp. ID2617S]|nr:NAD(P)H-quinone oxidoreductase [Naumannella sp. ID2617S]
MRAVLAEGAGGPEVLRVGEVETPTPGPGQVLVKVTAAGINRADVMQRLGHYPPPPGESEVIGLEVSGTVAALGADVDDWSVGMECLALLSGGGYAEYVAVPAGQLVPPPPGVDLVTAAGVLEVAATVQSNAEIAHLGTGDAYLVHGGAGGIGSFAIQYAKALGCTVFTTAGSAEKLQFCRELGADHALDYHDDWSVAVQEAGGVDVILDNMGAKYLDANLTALRPDGRLTVIGLMGGRKGELNLGALLAKRGQVIATSLRSRPAKQKAAICTGVVERVWPMIADGSISTAPTRRFALDEVAAAHEYFDSGEHRGKLVLTM